MPTSGIEWKKGVVVTAHHGVRRDEEIRVSLADGNMVTAKLVGRDPSTDLAVLRIEGVGGLAPKLGDSAALKLGQFVLALGRTRRGDLVASSGIVGGISGKWKSWRGGLLDQHIRLDLALYPGFSGGPLVNARGEIVGVNTRGLSRGRAVTVPVATVNRVVDELLEKGHIARPYLGLAMQPVAVPETLRGQVKDASSALLVVHVEKAGPAEKSGIQLGDIITEFHGQPSQDTGDILDLLGKLNVGDTIKATVLRGGVPVTATIKLEDRPR